MQIYVRNSCAGQKHRGRWRLISRQMFAQLHIYVRYFMSIN